MILKIFDPIMLPKAKPVFPLDAAIRLVTNSGKDVPKAMAKREIKEIDIPKVVAIDIAESIKRLPPIGSKIIPKIKNEIDLYNGSVVRLTESLFSEISVALLGIKNKYKEKPKKINSKMPFKNEIS